MQLLVHLTRLPFSVAFDILFRHGGFAAFVCAHGSNTEALYQFWRIFFISSPIGRLNPKFIGDWVDIMYACHVVQSLPHPVHAIYLLRPMRHEIPESVEAWRIAGVREILAPEKLILAMRVFVPRGHQPLLQREWFWVSDVHYKRPLHEWLRFADEVISNHFFTRYWWTQQKEGPFTEGGQCMIDVIKKLAHRETSNLKQCLKREETMKMLMDVTKAKAKKEWMQQITTHKGQKPGKHSSHSAKSIPNKKNPIALTTANKKEIDHLTHLRFTQYTSTLSQVKSTLSSIQFAKLDENFRRVLCLVTSLCRQFPRVKWNIKLALHDVMVETGRSNWDIERELYKVLYRQDVDPLEKLMKLSDGKRKK